MSKHVIKSLTARKAIIDTIRAAIADPQLAIADNVVIPVTLSFSMTNDL